MKEKRHIIIGDVHGCNQELNSLINKIDLTVADKLYFIGDLIDKGPDSFGVIQTVYNLTKKFDVKLILGNHEEKFLRFIKNKKENEKAFKTMTNIEEFELLYKQISEPQLEMIRNAYFYYKIEEIDFMLMHAGIPNGIELMHKGFLKYGTDVGKASKKIRLLTMTRYLDKNGDFLSLGQQSEGQYFWAEKYNGKYGTIIFGHEAFIGSEVKNYENAIGIDTGCVYGGSLTALVVDESNSPSTVSVSSLIKDNSDE
uniref:metallophosphoesterase n=1 Tax=Flavobacterium sp. TaxID=239 RepID=UPI00404916DD